MEAGHAQGQLHSTRTTADQCEATRLNRWSWEVGGGSVNSSHLFTCQKGEVDRAVNLTNWLGPPFFTGVIWTNATNLEWGLYQKNTQLANPSFINWAILALDICADVLAKINPAQEVAYCHISSGVWSSLEMSHVLPHQHYTELLAECCSFGLKPGKLSSFGPRFLHLDELCVICPPMFFPIFCSSKPGYVLLLTAHGVLWKQT